MSELHAMLLPTVRETTKIVHTIVKLIYNNIGWAEQWLN